MPRPSKEYKIEVLPRIYLEPRQINFGNLKKGKMATRKIFLHNGLLKESKFLITGNVTRGSECLKEVEKLPRINTIKVMVPPGQTGTITLKLSVPEDGCWGDFGGNVILKAGGNELYRIDYFVHVPSVWEYVTFTVIILFLILIILLGILIYLWGTLGRPKGVLQVLQSPIGIIVSNSYDLGQVKRKNLLYRLFNWHRNRVSIGGKNSDIHLPSTDYNLRIELLFVRWSNNVYIFNRSVKDSGIIIKVTKPTLKNTPYFIKPGQTITIEHNTIIEIDGYRFKYLNF